jgi:hypothetical protein
MLLRTVHCLQAGWSFLKISLVGGAIGRVWAVSLLGPPHPTFFFKPLFFISHQAVDFGD